jgi:hypothetical protein
MNMEAQAQQKQEQLPAPRRDPLNIDFSDGLRPTTYNELMQLAQLYHASGLAPKSLDTVQKIAIGMATCMEIGIPVFTGLQHMAVINGKSSLWGSGVLSVVEGSGLLEEFEESEEGEPFTDKWTFTCKLKRKGRKAVTHSFSWADAKRAGFDHPKTRDGRDDIWSPWKRFPKRMMVWKARSWPLQDQFADILRGLRAAEDMYGVVEMEADEHGRYSVAEKTKAKIEDLKTRMQPKETEPQEESQGQEEPEKKKYHCSVEGCDFSSDTQQGLAGHMRTHKERVNSNEERTSAPDSDKGKGGGEKTSQNGENGGEDIESDWGFSKAMKAICESLAKEKVQAIKQKLNVTDDWTVVAKEKREPLVRFYQAKIKADWPSAFKEWMGNYLKNPPMGINEKTMLNYLGELAHQQDQSVDEIMARIAREGRYNEFTNDLLDYVRE